MRFRKGFSLSAHEVVAADVGGPPCCFLVAIGPAQPHSALGVIEMMRMRLRRKAIIALASLLGAAFVLWGLLWIQLFACFPSEQVQVTSVSPDGSKTARFSVKWEGIHRWLPYDIEPQYYLTVTENTHSRILVRQSAYQGDMKTSFSELASKHAPWAITDLASAQR
jgi:hypothetical protein